MTIFLYCLILSTAFDFCKKQKHIPVFIEMRQTIQPQRELTLCAIHFRRKTYCRLQVVHSACIWKLHCPVLTHVSERVGRGKLTVQSPLHLPSPSCNLLISHKFGIYAFTWFSRKMWHPFYSWSDKFPSFHPTPFCCRSLEVLQYISSIPQNQVISPQAGPCSASMVRLCLRWHGYCSLCMSAWRPTLQVKVWEKEVRKLKIHRWHGKMGDSNLSDHMLESRLIYGWLHQASAGGPIIIAGYCNVKTVFTGMIRPPSVYWIWI